MRVEIEPPCAYVYKDGASFPSIKVRTDSLDAEHIKNARYCIVMWDGISKYWFLELENRSLHYGLSNKCSYSLDEITSLHFYSGESFPKGASIYRIMEDGPMVESFALSYMPEKRHPITYGQRVIAYRKYGGHCAYCGRKIEFEKMQVDHLVSHYRNQGKDETANYMPSCADCNGFKSDYGIEEFRELIRRCAFSGKGTRGYRLAMRYGLISNPKKRIVFYFEKTGELK